MSDEAIDPLAEVRAMQKVAEALAGLDADATARVLHWATAFYKVSPVSTRTGKPAEGSGAAAAGPGVGNGNGNTGIQFGDLPELYAAVSPETDVDKTLVGAYWAQFGEGRPEFTAQEVNTALKNLGHPIKNITSAFDILKARRPQLVMQLKKAGTTKQARKTYRLSVAGKSAVEAMVGQQQH